MPTIHEDYLTAYYDEDSDDLVVKNESSDHTAYNVSIKIGGVPFDQHQGTKVGPGADRDIEIKPEDDSRVPFERTQEGPSESYMVDLIYSDENEDEHRDMFNIHL